MQVGDRVKMADADDPRSIPAYRALRGKVVEVTGSRCRVYWDCDMAPEPFPRFCDTVVVVPLEERK